MKWKIKFWFLKDPLRLLFGEVEQERYVGGIAYGTEIICGCCGGVVEIAEVYEFAPEGVRPIIVYEVWEAFDDFIIADNERHFEREEEEEEEDECV